MRKKTKRIISICIFFIIFTYLLTIVKYQLEMPIYKMFSCLKLYVNENDGNLPLNQQDLVNKGYLLVEKGAVNNRYVVKCDMVEIITRDVSKKKNAGSTASIDFAKFWIRYGIESNSLYINRGKVYDKVTNKPLLLFSGPFDCVLRSTYNRLSVELYNHMVNEKEKK